MEDGYKWITIPGRGPVKIKTTNKYMNDLIGRQYKVEKKLNDNEDDISEKEFSNATKIDDKLERAIQMQVADDVGKELDDDDIRFRAENYIRNNYNGSANDEEIFNRLKQEYKNRGWYKETSENKGNFQKSLDDLKRVQASEYLQKNTYLTKEQADDYVSRLEKVMTRSEYENEMKNDPLYPSGYADASYENYIDSMVDSGNISEDEAKGYLSNTRNNNDNSNLINAIKNNKMNYEDDGLGGTYSAGDLKKGYYIQFQDREKRTGALVGNRIRDEKTESLTWARVWKDGKLVKNIEDNKFKARQQIIDFLQNDNKSNDTWLRNAFNEYKKQHPGTKLTIADFKKQNK